MRHGSFQGRRNNNRHRGGQQGGGGHQPRQNSGNQRPHRNQIFDSNGPDVRVRGTAFQINEKYLALAKDAASSGDIILAENYLQHAEHYQRLINEFEPVATSQPHYENNSSNSQPQASEEESASGGEELSAPAEAAEEPIKVVRRERRPAPAPITDTDDADLGLPSNLFGASEAS